jgi:hypothetical protein
MNPAASPKKGSRLRENEATASCPLLPVNRRGVPPAALTAYTSKRPFFVPSNRIVDPSGDQPGLPTKGPLTEVNWNAPLPSAFAIQIW